LPEGCAFSPACANLYLAAFDWRWRGRAVRVGDNIACADIFRARSELRDIELRAVPTVNFIALTRPTLDFNAFLNVLTQPLTPELASSGPSSSPSSGSGNAFPWEEHQSAVSDWTQEWIQQRMKGVDPGLPGVSPVPTARALLCPSP